MGAGRSIIKFAGTVTMPLTPALLDRQPFARSLATSSVGPGPTKYCDRGHSKLPVVRRNVAPLTQSGEFRRRPCDLRPVNLSTLKPAL